MEKIKMKFGFLAEKKWRERIIYGAAGALVLILVWLCISIHMHANIQRKYSSAADMIEMQLYDKMCAMTQTFDYIAKPNVDVQYKLIPELESEYSAVLALNNALHEGFGKKYAVLSDEQVAAFDLAFEEFESAYRDGMATGLAEADMHACMADIQQMINRYYGVDEKEGA